MARALCRGYAYGVAWIAMNDNEGSGDGEKEISQYLTTALLGDLFNKTYPEVGRAVAEERRKRGLKVGGKLKQE